MLNDCQKKKRDTLKKLDNVPVNHVLLREAFIKKKEKKRRHLSSQVFMDLHASSLICIHSGTFCTHSGTFWFFLHAFWNFLNAFWNFLHAFWNILNAFCNILKHFACFLERSGTFYMHSVTFETFCMHQQQHVSLYR